MFDNIRLERRYNHPPEKVWSAITNRVALADWLMPNDFEPVVGHRFTFQVDPMNASHGGITDCEVLEVAPPRKLVYTWSPRPAKPADKPPGVSTVSWTLTPHEGGTILLLEHTGLTAVYPWLFRFMLRFGWGTMVKRWIPKVAGAIGADGTYTPGVIGSTRWRYQAKTVPAHLTKAP